MSGLFITTLSPEKIKVDDNVKQIMSYLRTEQKLELCYTPVTYLEHKDNLTKQQLQEITQNDNTTIKILFQNTRSLHKHFQDILSDENYTSADIMFFAETRLTTIDSTKA